MKRIETIVNACVERGYVDPDRAAWLHYALIKRTTSFITAIPVFAIGLLLANVKTFFSFFISFYLMRSATNGWHARSFIKCFVCSLIAEICFLSGIGNVRNPIVLFLALCLSVFIIWILSPYNHPSMSLSEEEYTACKKTARKRLIFLTLLSIIFQIFRDDIGYGIQLGIEMDAFALLLAYTHKAK